MNFKYLALAVIVAAGFSSCSSSKTVLPYFTDIVEIKESALPHQDYMPLIQPDDELAIYVSSASPAASAAYNLPYVNPVSRDMLTSSVSPRMQTYIVDSKGDIDFPVVGTIHVQGLTTEQVKELLTKKIEEQVKDPVVTVQFVNFTITVAGEVSRPSRIKVDGNRISILDALAEAGDLTPYGERSNVLLIREENGERKYIHLNLNSSDVLTSPYYYLQQNDYVYVSPNNIRQANSKYNQNNAFKLSVISTIVSAASVIASLVIALTVK